LQEDGSPAGYSNFGPTVDLQAPGDQILSTVPGGYERMSGTSMASPFVAGAAALVRAARPDVDAARTLISTARSNPAARDGFGAGVVDPVAAVAGAGACAGGCATLEVPAAPAADEAPVLLMKQSVSAPRRVRTGKQKALPSLSDHSVQVRRWRSKNPAKCATRRSQLYGGWKVVGKRPGVCRIKVVVPKADGIEPLKVTLRVRVVRSFWRNLRG
jgi:hypothetical protein